MDILYLLVPLSVVLVFFILAGLWWAIDRGQFEDIEAEGARILDDADATSHEAREQASRVV